MITCQKCGVSTDRSKIENIQVELRDGSQQYCSLCLNYWDKIQPGEWVRLLGAENEAGEEVRQLYWTCDLCQGVWRYDGIGVFVREDQPPSHGEFLVCEECQKTKVQGILRPVPKAQAVSISNKGS